MTGARPGPEAERLLELEDVTRRYAGFGGLGLGPAGICSAGAACAVLARAWFVASVLSSAMGRLLLISCARACRFYQRHGVVVSDHDRALEDYRAAMLNGLARKGR